MLHLLPSLSADPLLPFFFRLILPLGQMCRRREGHIASNHDGVIVARHAVALSRLSFRPNLPFADGLRGRNLAPALSSPLGVELLAGLARLEQIFHQVEAQPRAEDFLRFWPDRDNAAESLVCRLVLALPPLIAAGPVHPHLARHL